MTRRKLIEVSLPLVDINRESARENFIYKGNPSSVHKWWAQRPLATVRAVLFAQLVDDPSSHPDEFPTPEAQAAERERLHDIIRRLVVWENMNDEALLKQAHVEILKSTDGNPPAILDPFAGGGTIPLEAQRLGLEAHASDLNPVAVLITKALIEIPPRFAGRSPVNPGAQNKLGDSGWHGAQGLAEDVRRYGRWMRDEAEKRLGHLYPKVTLAPSQGGGEAPAIAWLWTRTAKCPNPACGCDMPLVNSWSLSVRSGREAWVEPSVDRSTGDVQFLARTGRSKLAEGTVGKSGVRCLVCGATASLDYVRSEGQARGLGMMPFAAVAQGDRRRLYVSPVDARDGFVRVAAEDDVADVDLAFNPRYMSPPLYGMTKHRDLFTGRQLLTLDVFTELVQEARQRVARDSGDQAYANAISAYLSLSIGRLANRGSLLSFWNPNRDTVEQVFARNALSIVWVFAEANPFSDSSGNYLTQLEYLCLALERTPAQPQASVQQLDARVALPIDDGEVGHVVTDPPYYDNVPYADLSDFFYVWLRKSAGTLYPALFSTLTTPKAPELVADPVRQDGPEVAAKFFEEGLGQAFSHIYRVQTPAAPFVVFYAFKQAETRKSPQERSSTGWETMLRGLVEAGFAITGTWPMRTEQPGGLREHGRNSLASSIAIVCRHRLRDAPMTTRREFLATLKSELPDALKKLQHGNIAPVDLAQASIGPGMSVFTRYSRVVETDGSPMTVRTALTLINQALDEVVAEQEGEFDADTRWAIAWFEQFGVLPGEYGVAETLSKAKDTSVDGMVRAGIVEANAGKVRLLGRGELPEGWDPATDERLTVWEMTQHLISRLDEGEALAAALARRLGGSAEIARDLAYRLYLICERKKWSQEGQAYNGLVVAWPQIQRLAAAEPAASGSSQTSFEV